MNIDRNGRAHPPLPAREAAIAGALARPLGAPALDRFVEPGDRVAVLQDESLPPELRALAAGSIAMALAAAGAAEVAVVACAAPPPMARTRERNEPPPAEVIARAAGARSDAAPFDQLGAEVGSRASGVRGEQTTEARFLAVARAPRIGVVRLLAEVARADKLVLLGACTSDPGLGRAGPGSLVAWGCADPSTRDALVAASADEASEKEVVDAVLLLAPPAFAVHLVLAQGRLGGVIAGDCSSVRDACARR